MKNGLFKELIKDLYVEWGKEERRFKETTPFGDVICNDFFVFLYGTTYTPSFDNITDIDRYLNKAPVDCILVCSRQAIKEGFEKEIQIYEYELNSYEIKGDCLTVNIRNNITKKFIL